MSPAPHRSHRTRRIAGVLAVAVALGVPAAGVGQAGAPLVETAPPTAPAAERAALVRRSTALATAASASTAAAASEGIRLESTTTYTLDPAASAVHVVYEATVTNQSAPEHGFGYTSYSYLPELGVPLVKEAVNVTATRADGTGLPARVDDVGSQVIAAAVVDLQPDLQYQDTQTVRLSYDIPPMAARTVGISRLNPAFATFPVFAFGDPGLASVEVVVPERFDVELIGSDLDRTKRDDQQVFAAAGITDPDTFDVSVVARDDEQLVAREVDLGEHDATVLGWPGDDEWVAFVADHLVRGVPAMADLLGLEWPAGQDMEVVETLSPYIYGYAGWYSPYEALMEIGDELDPQVVLHELSHAWFNHDLYDSRWVNEALANVYAARTLTALGATPPTPDPTDPGNAGALRLNEWSSPALQADLSFEEEAYGYDTSWGLLEQVVAEIGVEHLSEVVRASDAGHLPYAAPGRHDDHPGLHDWRHFLDLLVDVGGSTTAEHLFRHYVVSPDQVAQLDARGAARTAYAQLTADAGGWVPPLPVRTAMSRWDFDVAQTHLDATRALLPRRDEVVAALAELDLEPPDRLREAWERAETTGQLERELELARHALEAYRAAVREPGASDGILAAAGLALTDVGGLLDEAHAQLAAGDFVGAAATSADVTDLVAQATRSAVARAIALVGLVGMAVALRRSGLRPPPDWPSRIGPHTIRSAPPAS